jgi:oxalate decarboxylase/phosphoglucose isomerase-like protein (cupin superfamily)
MTSDKECLIKATKRQRVGGEGPGRNDFVTFAKIGEVAPSLVEKLNEIADRRDGNDLGGDNYNLSQICEIEEAFNAAGQYRQIILQEKTVDYESVDEHTYTRYNEDVIVPFFKQIYRLRISEMPAGHELNWHIDSDTSVMCRAQICLTENDSVFEFKRKGVVESFIMKPGEMWFVNTGWLHRVVAGKTSRRVAIFGFDYKDYTDEQKLLVK